MPPSANNYLGIQERLETAELLDQLRQLGLEEQATWSEKLSIDDLAPAFSAHFSQLLARLVLPLREQNRAVWETILEQLSQSLRDTGHPFSDLAHEIPLPPFRQLLEISRPETRSIGKTATERPDVPLAVSALLTGSSRSPSLISQIRKELQSADHADWLVSFIRWSGIRPLRDTLRRYTETPSSDGRPRLRVATTSYLGATDPKAIEFLLSLPRTEIRISYDTHRTRLHAKAYLFYRNSGFGSAYVGSANISRVALEEGLEWTAKISQYELPYLWRQMTGSFELHWEDSSEFEPVDQNDMARLRLAIQTERNGGEVLNPSLNSHFFTLRPYAFQQEILDQITAERRAHIDRHLIIAATGTGKTMIAAFDYVQFASEQGRGERPSLLFLVHREEILHQALTMFRQVLRDAGFGDLLVGGAQPRQTCHLFCSVQSWHSRGLQQMAPEYFSYVVIDEVHHVAADSYQAILNHLQPRVLLGLTATPERMDGKDIRNDFGGRFTHEIRLPDAIDRRLLAPFHYFAIADHLSIDLSRFTWQRGGYQKADLDKVFGANEVRAKWVFQQLLDTVTDSTKMRALGFCVSQAHACYMARMFSSWGLPAASLTAESPAEERREVIQALVQYRLRVIFTVDLYNEGVDIPEVDTILMLRPTESLTLYLQQLGRGLRLHADKPHLTVLDFIAPQHREFRYAARFRALSANPSGRIDRQIENGFPWLPSGCLIDLDRVASERILENIRNNIGMRRPQVIQSLAQFRHQLDSYPTLQQMLDWLHFDDIDDLLRHGLPCRLIQLAGGAKTTGLDVYERGLITGFRHLVRVTDITLLDALIHRLNTADRSSLPSDDTQEYLRLLLVYSLLWSKSRPGDGELKDVDYWMIAHSALSRDVLEIATYQRQRIVPSSGIYPSRTGVLELHSSYTREQILLALGKGRFNKPLLHQTGVLHLPDKRLDVFFVTINKSSQFGFSPTTLYEDYALTDRLFHWQSQSAVGPDSDTGQRYIHHRERDYQPMLFIRSAKRLGNGLTAPFYFCGQLTYVRHEGSHPMSIVWRLEHPMPARILRLSQREAA